MQLRVRQVGSVSLRTILTHSQGGLPRVRDVTGARATSDKTSDKIATDWRICNMPSAQSSQKTKLRILVNARSMMHAHELREAGISA